MTRRLPAIYDLDSMRASFKDPSHLWSAFSWHVSPEGHDFWSAQAKNDLTDEGRAALLEMIALAEAAEQAAGTTTRAGLISVTVSGGKYTVQQTGTGEWEALRYGEAWPAFRDSGPDNLHVALAYEVAALQEESRFLLARLDELTLDDDTDDLIRDWNGHVDPSIARLRSLVGAAA